MAHDPTFSGPAIGGRGGGLSASASADVPGRALIHPMILITLIALVSPVYFEIAGLLLTPSRIFFLLTVPILTIHLLSGKAGKLRALDYGVFLCIIWMAISVAIHRPSVLVTFVGSNAAMILGGYLISRCFVRNLAQFHGFCLSVGLVVLGLVPLAVMEALSGDMVIPPLIESVPGFTSHEDVNYERRMGLDRAQVVFAHPIHFGLFCSIALALVFVGLRGKLAMPIRWLWSGGVLLTVFLSVSSGPFLSGLLQLMLISYNSILKSVKNRWKILIWGSSGIYAILEVVSSGPAYYIIIERMTFSSHTAFVRRVLLEHGSASVMRNPIFGSGFGGFNLPGWMTGSIDNYWLALAMIYGLPALLALTWGVIHVLVKAGKRPFPENSPLANARLAWMVGLISVICTLLTVTIWSEVQSAVFLMFGAGVWLLDAEPEGEAGAPEPAPPRGTRYSRFAPGTNAPATPAAPGDRDPAPLFARARRPAPAKAAARKGSVHDRIAAARRRRST